MENKIFHLPAVGGVLREHYVEARLHNDDHEHPEIIERVTRLQDELAKSRGTPYYLILDPKTRRKRAVRSTPDLFGGDFLRFLQKAID